MGGKESRDTRGNANVQKGDRKRSSVSLLNSSGEQDESGRREIPTDPRPTHLCPRIKVVCRTLEICKVTIDGTDEEFNTCAEEATSRLHS